MFRSSSGLVCLTHEECIAKWNLCEEQRRRLRAQEHASKPTVAAPPLAVAQNDHKLKRLVGSAVNMVMQQFPALANGGVPTAAVNAQALVQTPAHAPAPAKRRRNPLFCNQFNTGAGCSSPKQPSRVGSGPTAQGSSMVAAG